MLIIQDGFAIRYEDEVKPTWDYSHLLATPTKPATKKDEKPAKPKKDEPKPKKAKREDFQMQLF